MIEPGHPVLPITRQCALVGTAVQRSTAVRASRLPRTLPSCEPSTGSSWTPRGTARVRWPGICGVMAMRSVANVSAGLMGRMGLAAVYQRPRTTVRDPQHRVWPYLLRGLAIDRPNQVWCADIPYVPMRRGFLYFVAVMEWFSRRVLAWRLSNTMEADFCIEALKEAVARGVQAIFNDRVCCPSPQISISSPSLASATFRQMAAGAFSLPPVHVPSGPKMLWYRATEVWTMQAVKQWKLWVSPGPATCGSISSQRDTKQSPAFDRRHGRHGNYWPTRFAAWSICRRSRRRMRDPARTIAAGSDGP